MRKENKNSCPSETELWNCKYAFEFVCPLKWDSLEKTESPKTRYCSVCQQNVYLCENPVEFVNQGNLGKCVAIPQEITPTEIYREYGKTLFSQKEGLMGRVARRNEDDYNQEQKWWQDVLNLNPKFNQKEIEDIRYRIDQTHNPFEY
jgi:hypothetical protein